MTTVSAPEWVDHVLAPNPGPMTLDGTNTWLLGAQRDRAMVVVDPGPLDESHLINLSLRGNVELILLTHGHADHSEGARRLRALTGAPIAAFDPAHGEHADALADGDRLEWADVVIDVLHTPGHSADSVSFLVQRAAESVLVTGDTILGQGTTMIDHPDGLLSDYFVTLDRLRGLGPVVVLPGHGPIDGTAVDKSTAYLAHRRARLAQVRSAVEAGARTPHDVVEIVYADVPRHLWPAAERSVAAQLFYLRTAL